jgi:CubicO group peptidase (beta-lactamase class C family)
MDIHRLIAFALIVLVGIALVPSASSANGAAEAPTAEQLKRLSDAVRGYVERDEVVGAEILVRFRGQTVLHEAFGLADRETGSPLLTDRIQCIRSMTKPLVGTAIQMLIDDGKIGLDDPAAKWLPAFSSRALSAITVRHLLEHSSGLRLSSLIARNMKELGSIDEVVEAVAAEPPAFTPGTAFQYSDDGADVLSAIVGKVAGMPCAEFLAKRVIDPLGMSDTSCGVPQDRSRCVNAYVGSARAWSKFWSPSDPPIFGCFLGSQGAYSTASDYAKLLDLWAHDGTVGGKRLLSHAAVERGLAFAHTTDFPSGLTGARSGYGQLWSVWEASPNGARLGFGHGGSDGTAAWCFPERALTVCYFSQSRGGLTPLSFEGEIDAVLFGHARSERSSADLEGWWRSEQANWPVLILSRDGKPTLDIPGRFSLVLKPGPDSDHWGFELDPSSAIAIERDANGAVVALGITSHGKNERWHRATPAADLPSLDAIMDKVRTAHGIARDGVPFPIERRGTLSMPALKRTIALVQRFEGVRSRVESGPPGAPPASIGVSDGTRFWSITGDAPAQPVLGAQAEQSMLEHPGRLFGDLRAWVNDLTVVGRIDWKGRRLVGLWCTNKAAPSMLVLIEEETGRVAGLERVVAVPGVGQVGVSTAFDDFRPITKDGRTVTLPFHAHGEFTSELLGTADTVIEACDTPERFDAGTFLPNGVEERPATSPAR